MSLRTSRRAEVGSTMRCRRIDFHTSVCVGSCDSFRKLFEHGAQVPWRVSKGALHCAGCIERDFQRDKNLDDLLSSLDMESSTSLLEASEQAVAT